MRYVGFNRPSFGLKRVGFDSPAITPPALQADFTTGTYKASGEAKTFDDLFTFSRAGKAWLVKDTGLVEYAIDAPRFDNGLLIEQSATNRILNSKNLSQWELEGGAATLVNADYYQVSQTDAAGIYSSNSGINAGDSRILSAYIKKTSTDAYVTLSGRGVFIIRATLTINTKNGVVTASREAFNFTVESVGDYYKVSSNIDTLGSPPHLRLTKTNFDASTIIAGVFTAGLVTHELGTVKSSYIVTTTTPVTRPADFLQTKVSGTTITGDWDSTLNLSISNGQIVHSGYGRIRSLEIR